MEKSMKDYMHELFMKHVADRVELIKAMHLVMTCMNNEDAYMEWITTMPDCPMLEDFEFFAEDEREFDELSDEFFRICNVYGEDGLFV